MSSGAVEAMGPMKAGWNTKDKCASGGLEVKWGTHWCPAVDMARGAGLPPSPPQDRALKTEAASGAWAARGLLRVEERPSSLGDEVVLGPVAGLVPGVRRRIVRGRHQDPNKIQCVTDPAATAHGSKKIAFACCDDANRHRGMDETPALRG